MLQTSAETFDFYGKPAEPFEVAQAGYEGPLDHLLNLARRKKIDLKQLSMNALASQFITWLSDPENTGDLSQNADALTAIAWLVDLKTRLLLPAGSHTPNPPHQANEQIARRLQHLTLIHQVANRLFAQPLLGHHVFQRGFSVQPRIWNTSTKTTSTGERIARRHFHITDLRFNGKKTWPSRHLKPVAAPAPAEERRAFLEIAEQYKPVNQNQLSPVQSLKRRHTIRYKDADRYVKAITDHHYFPIALEQCLIASEPMHHRAALGQAFSAILQRVKNNEISLHQTTTYGPIILSPKPLSDDQKHA